MPVLCDQQKQSAMRVITILFCFLFFATQLTSCAKAVAGVGIPAQQEFILGEYSNRSYKAVLKNQGTTDVTVSVRDKSTGEQTQGFGLAGSATVHISANEEVHLINNSDREAQVKVKLNANVQGMGYKALQK